ncbi:MAG: bifunctional adenosylcobinamide kinase/adenosylcobinamide-phosphate guanylyltransferase [Candidatus Omnitrophica bacterium]|nr:bifunctional adenosylcobinamide kinase/adenosylcobinamide-phosphate guanylyltransferase [Candidatus Omnitrophota bacterium]
MHTSKITLILGGARSGKSTYAMRLAAKYTKVAFIATAQALDREMEERIRHHRNVRPKRWKTFEEAKELSPLLKKITGRFNCLIIDCLTLLISNLILSGKTEDKIIENVNEMLSILRKTKAHVIFVSNEVGLGIVPDNALSRNFRDIAGKINQIVAQAADEVFFTVSGLPLKIKEKE